MPALGSLIVKLGMDYAEYANGWDKADQKTIEVGKRIQSTLDGVRRTASDFVGGVAAGIVAGLSVSAFKGIISGVIETGAALDDLSQQTGATVEALSALAEIGKYNDMSAQQIGDSMNKLAKNMAGSTEESKGAAKALDALGINFDTFKKLKPEDQMQTVAKAMDRFENGTGKSAVAMALYGKEGAKMIPFLSDLAQVSELQAKMTTEQAAASAKFDDNLVRVRASGEGWKKELAMGMLPAMDTGLQAFLDMTNGTGGLRDEVKRLSKDGSIAEWTTNAVKGLSYVADGVDIVIRAAIGLGKAFGGAVAASVTTIGTIGQALEKVRAGDAFGAFDLLKSGAVQVKSIVTDTYTDLAGLTDRPLIGAQFRASLDKMTASAKAAGDGAKEDRGNLDGFANTVEKAGKKASEAETEFQKLTKRIKERIDAARQEQEFGRALTEQEKFALKVVEDMNGAKKALTQTERDRITAMLKTSAAEEEVTEQQRVRIQSEKDLRAAEAQRVAGLEKTVQSSADANKQLREEIEMIGLTEAQQLAVTRARIDSTIAQKEQTLAGLQHASFMSREAIALEEEIRLLRERSTLMGLQFDRSLSAKQIEAASAEWTKFYDSVYNGLTDSLFRGFEAGKGFFETFWSGIRNVLKTSVLRLAIQGVLSLTPLGALATSAGGAGAIAGGGSSAASAAGSAYQIASGASAFGAFGSGFSQGIAAAVTNGGGAAFSTGASVAANGSISAGLGQMIGAAAPYLAAAAVVANALGLFKSKKVTDVGITGNLAGNNETSLLGYTETRTGGSLFSGPSYNRSQSEMGADQVQAIRGATDAVYGSIASYGAALGLNADTIRGYVQAINLSTKGLTSEQITASLEAQFAIFGDQLAARIAPGIGEFAKAGEQYRDALSRLASSMGAVNQVMDSLGQRSLDLSLAGGAAASALLDLVGGAENLQTLASGYQQNFYTEAERTAITLRQVGASLGAVGLGLPQTREEFRALVEAQDLMTASGRQAYAVLLGVSDAFAGAVPEIEAASTAVASLVLSATDLAKARESLEGELLQAQGNTAALRAREIAALNAQDPTGSLRALKEAIWAVGDAAAAQTARLSAMGNGYALLERSVAAQRTLVQAQYDSAAASVAKLSGIASRLRSTIDGMTLSGTEAGSRAEAQAQVAAALAIARAGGAGTINLDALAPALTRVAQSSEGMFDDYVSYARDYARTRADLQELAGLTGGAQSIAEQELAAAQGQIDRLDYILKVGKEHVDAINGGTVATVSVHDAVVNLSRLFAAATGVSHDAYASGSLGYLVPAHADGGRYAGGMALVGEEGPELINFRSPGQVYTAAQTQSLLSGGGGNAALLAELRELRREVAAFRATNERQTDRVIDHTDQAAATLRDAAKGARPLVTTTEAA